MKTTHKFPACKIQVVDQSISTPIYVIYSSSPALRQRTKVELNREVNWSQDANLADFDRPGRARYAKIEDKKDDKKSDSKTPSPASSLRSTATPTPRTPPKVKATATGFRSKGKKYIYRITKYKNTSEIYLGVSQNTYFVLSNWLPLQAKQMPTKIQKRKRTPILMPAWMGNRTLLKRQLGNYVRKRGCLKFNSTACLALLPWKCWTLSKK